MRLSTHVTVGKLAANPGTDVNRIDQKFRQPDVVSKNVSAIFIVLKFFATHFGTVLSPLCSMFVCSAARTTFCKVGPS
jgi:hypothetical protein